MPSLANTLRRCHSTVRGLMNSWVLISGLLRPLWDDVDWTVEGTHALCGRYRSKADFIAATFGRLQGVLVGGRNSKVRHIYVDGDTTIAELRSVSKTNEGATFANGYCWVCRFDGGMIVEVRAYLDSAMVDYTIHRNENLTWQ
jgi:ketosteroid isomerase-like protein